MNSLQNLSDDILIEKLERAVSFEKKNTARVVAYLAEMEIRKLYLERSYASLYVYAREVLKYSNGSSYRRVSAAYLSIEMPQTIEAIASGKLTLCAATDAWKTFEATRGQKKSPKKKETDSATPATTQSPPSPPCKKEKEELFDSLLGKSTTEARRELRTFEREKCGVDENKKARGKLIEVSRRMTELRVELDTENLEKLKKLQSLLSHRIPDGDPTQLIEVLLELGLEKLDPIRKAQRIEKRKNPSHVGTQNEYKGTTTSTEEKTQTEKRTRPVPQPLQLKIKTKTEYACQHIDEKTGKKCGSTWRLSIDHKFPFSKGGEHTEENLQLLCGRHNIWKSDRVIKNTETAHSH